MKFETGVGDLKKELRWRGKRYLSGLCHGLGFGLVVGLSVAMVVDVRAHVPLVWFAALACVTLLSALAGGAFLGRLRPEETEDKSPSQGG